LNGFGEMAERVREIERESEGDGERVGGRRKERVREIER